MSEKFEGSMLPKKREEAESEKFSAEKTDTNIAPNPERIDSQSERREEYIRRAGTTFRQLNSQMIDSEKEGQEYIEEEKRIQHEAWRAKDFIKADVQRKFATTLNMKDMFYCLGDGLNDRYVSIDRHRQALAQLQGVIAQIPHERLVQYFPEATDPRKAAQDFVKKALRGTYYSHCYYDNLTRDDRFEGIYQLASVLKGKLLPADGIVENIGEALRGKKILVWGDDVGTLSGILRSYGAEAYGVEIGEIAVKLAHLVGLNTPNLEPQAQLIEGDLTDLCFPDSALYQKLKALGPFDVMCSWDLVACDSRFEPTLRDMKTDPVKKEKLWTMPQLQLRLSIEPLLSSNGINIHFSTDNTMIMHSVGASAMHQLFGHFNLAIGSKAALEAREEIRQFMGELMVFYDWTLDTYGNAAWPKGGDEACLQKLLANKEKVLTLERGDQIIASATKLLAQIERLKAEQG